jgi:hypothetical protein
MRHFSIACSFAFLLAFSLSGCGGDDDGGSSGGPDATPAPACTGAVYDSCADTTGSTDCMDGFQCHYYQSAALTICVPTCSADNPCPDQGGNAVECNNMGICRPDMANNCSLP